MDPVSVVTDHTFMSVLNNAIECGFLRPDGEHCLERRERHEMKGIKVRLPVHATDTIPAVQAWDAFSAQVRDLLVRKAGYGNSWQHQGYMGNIGRVLSKADRLKEIMWRDGQPDMSVAMDGSDRDPMAESVIDTLMDIGPLAAFAIANLEGGNRWGR